MIGKTNCGGISTADATAASMDIKVGKTAYGASGKMTGELQIGNVIHTSERFEGTGYEANVSIPLPSNCVPIAVGLDVTGSIIDEGPYIYITNPSMYKLNLNVHVVFRTLTDWEVIVYYQYATLAVIEV